MSLSTPQACVLSLLFYVLWRVLYKFFVKSTLSDIRGPARTSWWKGNFHQVFSTHGRDFHRLLSENYGGIAKLNMLFGDEQLYVSDPLALHYILVKDQYAYEETDEIIKSNSLVFGMGLLTTLGEHHRKQRKMLNPVFSLKHMRSLIPIFYPIAHNLRKVLENQIRDGAKEMNIMKWISRAALEYIGQGGLGYKFDALDEGVENKYSSSIKLLNPTLTELQLPQLLLPPLVKIGSPAFRRRILEWIPSRRVQTMRKIVDTMEETSEDIYNKKKIALERGDKAAVDQVGMGNDIMSILLKANMEANEEDRLPESELLAQMNTFIFAGHDTTTGAVCRVLHQLSMNPNVQSRLRAEVRAARAEHGDLAYDVLMGLPYLDAVCRETLRVFPPAPLLPRTTRRDVVLPLLWPITATDGITEIREIPIKDNTGIIVSILNANCSKRIWGEDAGEWKPERWLRPLPDSVSNAHLPGVYSSMMTFSGGGRSCIGFKFAEMEMKLVLSILLERFAFTPGSKEIYWAMNFLQTPVIKDSPSVSPQLPLKVSFAE
ncbi:hypothetical protein M0805_002037 [Coniferiporia weirii]|nr:hypothetical protein M0805_002037 [Coniferiporia weirii]